MDHSEESTRRFHLGRLILAFAGSLILGGLALTAAGVACLAVGLGAAIVYGVWWLIYYATQQL